jgi:hypothetical protein
MSIMTKDKLSFLILILVFIGCRKTIVPVPESSSSVHYFQGGKADQLKAVIDTKDGGFIYCGYTIFDSSKTDGFLMKVDKDGNQEWYKTYGGADMDEFSTVIQTSDGGFLAAGRTNSIGLGQNNHLFYDYVVKVGPNGEEEWSKSFFLNPGEIKGCCESPDHNYYFTGYNSLTTTWAYILNLVKVDAAGNRIFIRNYTGITSFSPYLVQAYYHVYGLNVMFASDGGLLLSGTMSKSNKTTEIGTHVTFTMKTNANGNIVSYFYPYYSDVRSGDYYYNIGFPTVKTMNLPDGYLIGTFVDGLNDGVIRTQLMKTDFSGNRIWEKKFTGVGNALLYNMKAMDNGELLLIGASTEETLNVNFSSGFKNLKPMLTMVDKDGNVLWEQVAGSVRNATAYRSARILADGSILAAGSTMINEVGADKLLWINLDKTGKPISSK